MQTDEMTEAIYAYDNPVTIDDDCRGSELVIDVSGKARVVN